jgi:transposase
MHYVGIDLHKRNLVLAVEDERGPVGKAQSFSCKEAARIKHRFERLRPFRAVIEASGSYRWLYDLLSPLGEVVLAHPLRLRAIVSGRAKTDKLDARLLAQLLRAGLIPTSYVPPKPYAELRDLTRSRARLVRHQSKARNELHALLARRNVHPPLKTPFGKAWRRFVTSLDLGMVDDTIRDEIFERLEHYERKVQAIDERMSQVAEHFPQTASLLDIHGIGLFSALLIVAEIGEPERFRNARKVGAYAGLTARVNQSGGHCYYGHITRQGSPWLRWVLVQAAMHAVRKDRKLANFYERIRKRSSAKIARVAVARKLAGICWLRLRRWQPAAQAA